LLEREGWSARHQANHGPNLLTPQQQAKLGQIATVVRHDRAGLEIITEGAEATSVFVIEAGLVSVSVDLPDGSRQVVDFARAGDLIGLVERGRHVNTAATLTPVTLYQLSRAALAPLLLGDAALQSCLLAKATNDLRAAQWRIVALGRASVARRVAAFLLECCRLTDIYAPAERLLRLPMSRFTIADYLGTSPESIARAFAGLEDDGLIRRSSPRLVEIRDLPSLGQMAQGLC
jgi:CRP-like cAMP-binding protein